MIDKKIDSETRISRYMSFATFSSLITTRKMFFPALSTFSDKHEGSGTESDEIRSSGIMDVLKSASEYARAITAQLNEKEKKSEEELEKIEKETQQIFLKHKKIVDTPRILETPFGDMQLNVENHYRKIMSAVRKWIDVSCWHKNIDESLAMWKIYGGSAEAVCLNSTVGALNSSIIIGSEIQMRISEVKYIDYQDYEFDKTDVLASALHKQKPYDYEKEIRAVIWNDRVNIFEPRNASGRLVDINLETLMQSVRLSPAAQPWFKNLVETSIENFPNVKVEQSIIDREPTL